MKYERLLKQSDLFLKRANGQLESLLSSALKNLDRELFIVFLDLLEEQQPETRARLTPYLMKNLFIFRERFPSVVQMKTTPSELGYLAFESKKLKGLNVEGTFIAEYDNLLIDRYLSFFNVAFKSPIEIAGFDVSRIEVFTLEQQIHVVTPNNPEPVELDEISWEYKEFYDLANKLNNRANADVRELAQVLAVPTKENSSI